MRPGSVAGLKALSSRCMYSVAAVVLVQPVGEARDRHVRDREQAVEHDPVPLAEVERACRARGPAGAEAGRPRPGSRPGSAPGRARRRSRRRSAERARRPTCRRRRARAGGRSRPPCSAAATHTTSHCWAARNSGRSCWPGSCWTVRLCRTIVRRPSARACRTISRKRGCSSGAPPVTSSVSHSGALASAARQASTTASGITSVRSGPASTWQWRQAWLHFLPTLIWSVVTRSARSSPPWRARYPSKRARGGVSSTRSGTAVTSTPSCPRCGPRGRARA